ncbi:MAG: pilin, partial [Patescibacteria group bacterium]|nr:pilin [Patescibacteria group bacterium]
MKYTFIKKFYTSLLTICLLTILATPVLVFGQSTNIIAGLDQTATKAEIDTGNTDLSTRLGSIINYFFGIMGVIFLVVVLVGGYSWMTAGGNEEKVGKAKKWIFNGIN